MKIHITIPLPTANWFWNINNLLVNSLRDCGHEITELEKSEIVISIQYFQNLKKEEGKKYILLQTEQKEYPGINVEGYYKFADKIWGFHIDSKKEEYLVLGYHPCLELKSNVNKIINVGFFGCTPERRLKFFKSIQCSPKIINSWDYNTKLFNIKKTKIMINYHNWAATSYTEWDRICLILANKSFLLSENFYCPLKINQFNSISEYNDSVSYFLNHEKEREEIASKLYEEYKTKYDMRKILGEKLKCI